MSAGFKSFIILCLMLLGLTVKPACGNIRIGLLSLRQPLSLTVRICEGDYNMLAGGYHLLLKKNDNILIVRAGNKVLVTTSYGNTFLSDSLLIQSVSPQSCFSVRNNLREGNIREYYGHLTVFSDIGSLMAVNTIDTESYLAGVVQAEAGFKGNLEFFKVQAMLARTYLYMNIRRHMLDGYNLCDEVHCQAYHGRAEVERIYEAVSLTKDRVLVNADSFLVFSPFHSNCGGQTESSDNVWLTAMQHLPAVTDPYCGFSRNARWKKKIAREEWISYLSGHGYRHIDEDNLVFKQLSRMRDYKAGDFSFPLNKIREDWGLRSTFFSVSLDGDSLVFDGRGYGHGVGLCQEGAMVMAERGFRMEEILGFYFRGLLIINVRDARKPLEINSAF